MKILLLQWEHWECAGAMISPFPLHGLGKDTSGRLQSIQLNKQLLKAYYEPKPVPCARCAEGNHLCPQGIYLKSNRVAQHIRPGMLFVTAS